MPAGDLRLYIVLDHIMDMKRELRLCAPSVSILVCSLGISNFRFLATDGFFNKQKNTLGAGL
jgi:hypothetical protein